MKDAKGGTICVPEKENMDEDVALPVVPSEPNKPPKEKQQTLKKAAGAVRGAATAVANATTQVSAAAGDTVGKMVRATAAAANATTQAAAAAGGSIGRATKQVANGTTVQIERLKNASASGTKKIVNKLKPGRATLEPPA